MHVYMLINIYKYQTNLSLLAPGEHIEIIMKKDNTKLLDFFIKKYPNNIHYVKNIY